MSTEQGSAQKIQNFCSTCLHKTPYLCYSQCDRSKQLVSPKTVKEEADSENYLQSIMSLAPNVKKNSAIYFKDCLPEGF